MEFSDEHTYDYNDTYEYIDYDEYYIIERPEMPFLSFDSVIKTVYRIVIFCISALGNSFLLWVLLRERRWKNTPDNLILQLTVSALCFTVSLPFWVCGELNGWVFGIFACRIMGGVTFLGLYSCTAIITAMTFYHYVAVDHASCLSAQTSKKLLLLTSIVIWLICGAASITVSISFDIYVGFSSPETCDLGGHEWMNYHILEFGLFFLMPFIIIAICFVYRATKRCKINRQHQAPRLILGITIGLFLCLGPYYILIFSYSLEWLEVVETIYPQVPHYVKLITVLLFHTHCFLNLFHICGAQKFRRYLCMPCGTSPQRRDESQDVSTMAVMLQNDMTV